MTEGVQKIVQCGLCNRATDESGVRLAEQPSAREFTQAFLAGEKFYRQLVCTVCQVNPPKQEEIVLPARRKETKAQATRQSCTAAKRPAPVVSGDVHRGCPSDDEENRHFVTARDFSQSDFESSGAAASADDRLWNFFFARDGKVILERFDRWFSSVDLEDVCRSSRRMNNRAITFRARCVEFGLYLDNRMFAPAEGAAVSSHYRLCKIEDALSLSEDAKWRLCHPGEEPNQQNFTTNE